MDIQLSLAIDQIRTDFPTAYTGDGRPLFGALWVNPEDAGDSNIPAIIITKRGIWKTGDRFEGGPDLHDLRQLSYDDYSKYFPKGLDLLKQFSEIEKFRNKGELTPEELQALFHLIYRSGGGSEDYEAGIMVIDE